MIMKKGIKFLAIGTAIAAAAGLIVYRKYYDSYEFIPEEVQTKAEYDEESDFEPMVKVEDDFDYYIEDIDQIMFYE